MAITIAKANIHAPAFIALIDAHLQLMHDLSPPDSMHALPIDALHGDNVTVWQVMDAQTLVGCGALKQITPRHGEIKTMHTKQSHRGKGIARALVEHMLVIAGSRGYSRLSLETGPEATFAPAHRLYETYGFTSCGPFADYTEHPHSHFMTLEL